MESILSLEISCFLSELLPFSTSTGMKFPPSSIELNIVIELAFPGVPFCSLQDPLRQSRLHVSDMQTPQNYVGDFQPSSWGFVKHRVITNNSFPIPSEKKSVCLWLIFPLSTFYFQHTFYKNIAYKNIKDQNL